MEKASKNISVVEPTFSVRPPSNQERISCEICLKSCIKKHKLRSKLEKIVDIKTFKLFAERWHQKQHEYNKVLNFVDWTNEQEHYAHKSCKGTFFKENFLNTQINIEHNETEEITEINQTENDNSNVEPQLSRRSNRKSLEYKSSQEQRKCIICNFDRFLKGCKVALQNL